MWTPRCVQTYPASYISLNNFSGGVLAALSKPKENSTTRNLIAFCFKSSKDLCVHDTQSHRTIVVDVQAWKTHRVGFANAKVIPFQHRILKALGVRLEQESAIHKIMQRFDAHCHCRPRWCSLTGILNNMKRLGSLHHGPKSTKFLLR